MIPKNDILETLREWNFWDRALPETFAQKHELKHARDAQLMILVPDVNELVEFQSETIHVLDLKMWLLGIE